MSRTRLAAGLLAALFLIVQAPLSAQDPDAPPKPDAKSKSKSKAKSKPKGKSKGKSKAGDARQSGRSGARMYMGRPIAGVMGAEGADWLMRPTREEEEQPEAMLDALKIRRGSTVADVGAGVGYTSVRLAQRVGPDGQVLATDLQREMLQMLVANAREEGITNIRPIQATPSDPKLPEGKVDLVLMVDVYHECSDPEATLKGLRKALKPGGRLVLVEFRGEDPDVPIRPEHKMTAAQVRKEIEPQGFTFKEKLDFLPWQHIIIFEKPAGKGEDEKEKTKKADEKEDEKTKGKDDGKAEPKRSR